jgi:cytochrome c6
MFIFSLFLAVNNPALAADINHGKQLFGGNCASCHAGGLNVVVQAKTLKQDALEANGKNSVAAIVAQITNGAGAMPKFSNLSETDKEDIATYVLAQAEKDWK